MVLKIKRDVDGYTHKDTRITAFKIEKSLSSCSQINMVNCFHYVAELLSICAVA